VAVKRKIGGIEPARETRGLEVGIFPEHEQRVEHELLNITYIRCWIDLGPTQAATAA